MAPEDQPPQRLRQPIGRTLIVNLAGIGLLFLLALFLLLSTIIHRSFTELEDRQVADQKARLEAFKTTRLEEIEARTKDWGNWDHSFQYAQDFNSAYEAENVRADSFANLLVDAFQIIRNSDLQYRSFAFSRETGEPLPELSRRLAARTTSPQFAAGLAETGEVQSFVNLDGRIYALGAANITLNDGSGEPPGYLVFLSAVDDASASAALQSEVTISAGPMPAGPLIRKLDEHIAIKAPFLDEQGQQVGFVEMTLPRPLMRAADRLILLALGGAVAVVAALLIVLQLRVRHLVLTPIERLHAHLQSVRSTGELQRIDGGTRDDEFGAAQAEFNHMAHELQQLRTQLDSQSFALGKSQSAIGLVHNLRNCLSPVRVILDTLEGQLGPPLPVHAGRALEELRSAELDPERREKLVRFLDAAHEDIKARSADTRHSVREAARNLLNAFEAIDSAQKGKGEVSYSERCELASLLSHAANVARFIDSVDISIDVRADPFVVARGNRVLVSQVFENLIMNAAEAIRKAGRSQGSMVLSAFVDEASKECRVIVTDDGIGFDPALAPQLFERGYSTREGRSGGLGLHWCANTIKAMGGSLALASEGKGRGATARISLALWQESTGETPIAA